jgi:hypothetical protein
MSLLLIVTLINKLIKWGNSLIVGKQNVQIRRVIVENMSASQYLWTWPSPD